MTENSKQCMKADPDHGPSVWYLRTLVAKDVCLKKKCSHKEKEVRSYVAHKDLIIFPYN